MPNVDRSSVNNRLLKDMTAADFALLAPHLMLVHQHAPDPAIRNNTDIAVLSFPESGLISVIKANKTRRMEVGLIGYEGLVGATPVLLGIDRSPFDFLVQVSGEHYQIERRLLLQAIDDSPALKLQLLRYVQTFIVQIAGTAFANGAYSLEVRLARWLLMYRDRMPGDRLPITHEFLAIMLGVRRAGVTEALHVLEGHRLIKASRGLIVISDRRALRSLAGDSYDGEPSVPAS